MYIKCRVCDFVDEKENFQVQCKECGSIDLETIQPPRKKNTYSLHEFATTAELYDSEDHLVSFVFFTDTKKGQEILDSLRQNLNITEKD